MIVNVSMSLWAHVFSNIIDDNTEHAFDIFLFKICTHTQSRQGYRKPIRGEGGVVWGGAGFGRRRLSLKTDEAYTITITLHR
jgi:hypothetical protein